MEFIHIFLSVLRGLGAFRENSPNYAGKHAVENVVSAFAAEGYELSSAGELRPMLLDNLTGAALTDALQAYVRRAKRGAQDAALVTGTSKDLLEAVAAHIRAVFSASSPAYSSIHCRHAPGTAWPAARDRPFRIATRALARSVIVLGGAMIIRRSCS